MSAKGKILSTKQIIKLATKHEASPYSVRDAALIACSGLSFMTLFDLSLLRVSDLMDSKGRIYGRFEIPPEYNPSGKSKIVIIPQVGYLREILDRYVDYRCAHGHGLSDLGVYRKLNPDSFFFLDDKGEPFSLTARIKGESTIAQMQPIRLRRLFKTFVLREGVTPNSLNQSFVMNFYRLSIEDAAPIRTLKSLHGLTGLSLETLRTWVKREPRSVEEILSGMYSVG